MSKSRIIQETADNIKNAQKAIIEEERKNIENCEKQISNWQGLLHHSERVVSTSQRNIDDINAAIVFLCGLDHIEDILKSLSYFERKITETDSKKLSEEFATKIVGLKDQLNRTCKHSFVGFTPYQKSYCSYEDDDPEMRFCLVCDRWGYVGVKSDIIPENSSRVFFRLDSKKELSKIRSYRDVEKLVKTKYQQEVINKFKKALFEKGEEYVWNGNADESKLQYCRGFGSIACK